MTSIADFLAFLAPGLVSTPAQVVDTTKATTTKHLQGKHDQARHAWRYGSVDAARRSMQGQGNPDERAEYRRRAGMQQVRGEKVKPEKRVISYKLPQNVIDDYRGNYQDNIEYDWEDSGLYGDPLEFAQKAYNIYDTGTGLRTKVTTLYYSKWDRGYEVAGVVLDQKGDQVGHFTRTINMQDRSVHHDYLRLRDDVREGGFGSRFYQNAEKQYRKVGIEQVDLNANIDVGGYAWARMGFDFAGRYTRDEFLASFENAWRRRYNAYLPPAVRRHLKHAWDFAALVGPDGYLFGKGQMIGTQWDAVKYIDPKSLGYRVGRAYYRSKR